jgi:hypothetical protein
MRHHGGVAATCIHGFDPGTCLICQTLDAGKNDTDNNDGAGRKGRRTVTASRKAALAPTGGAAPAVRSGRSGPRVVPQQAPAERSPRGLRLTGLAVALVIVLILAWVALHLVFAVLHIVELIGVALLAGYIGWLAGVYHGRRTSNRH